MHVFINMLGSRAERATTIGEQLRAEVGIQNAIEIIEATVAASG